MSMAGSDISPRPRPRAEARSDEAGAEQRRRQCSPFGPFGPFVARLHLSLLLQAADVNGLDPSPQASSAGMPAGC